MSESADRKIIEQAIDALGAIFPMWADRSNDRDTRYSWYRGLARAELTKDQIKSGIVKAERHDSPYAPSMGVFISWCVGRQEATPAQAYQQAALGQYTSPEALEAAKRTGEFDLKNNPSRDIRRLFEDHYRDVLDEKSAGKVFELPRSKPKPQAIEYTSEMTQDESDSEAKGRATFAALRAMMTQKAEEKTNVDTKLES